MSCWTRSLTAASVTLGEPPELASPSTRSRSSKSVTPLAPAVTSTQFPTGPVTLTVIVYDVSGLSSAPGSLVPDDVATETSAVITVSAVATAVLSE